MTLRSVPEFRVPMTRVQSGSLQPASIRTGGATQRTPETVCLASLESRLASA